MEKRALSLDVIYSQIMIMIQYKYIKIMSQDSSSILETQSLWLSEYLNHTTT